MYIYIKKLSILLFNMVFRKNNMLNFANLAKWIIKHANFFSNINWRDVQTKNVVNNVDMSCLRAPWQFFVKREACRYGACLTVTTWFMYYCSPTVWLTVHFSRVFALNISCCYCEYSESDTVALVVLLRWTRQK